VTGDVNPARLSNQLDFTVWSQDGEQIGEVEDMVLDLDNTQVLYVVVGTGGFLDLGEREILVPWNSLQLQSGAGDTTGGQQNAFILQSDVDTFSNAPDFDLNANLPAVGQPAGDWDLDIRNFWESGGASGGTANTPDASQGAGLATATVGADQGAGTGQTQGQALQGVTLASEILGSTVTLSPGEGPGQEQAQPTVDPNATADPNNTATATTGQGTGQDQGQGVGNIDAVIEDVIVDVETGEIQYIVLDATLEEGERWVPVPLSFIQWDASTGAFLLNANPATFRDAPFFEEGQFPDTSTSGWNSEFEAFWQNGGSNTQATPTP